MESKKISTKFKILHGNSCLVTLSNDKEQAHSNYDFIIEEVMRSVKIGLKERVDPLFDVGTNNYGKNVSIEIQISVIAG